MKNLMNTKYVAALAVFAMMFAGFGVLVADDGADASIVTDKGIAISYENDDAGLSAVATMEIDATESTETSSAKHLKNFAGEVLGVAKNVAITFEIAYTFTPAEGQTAQDVVPMSLSSMFDFEAKKVTITILKENDATTIDTVFGLAGFEYSVSKIPVKVVVPLAADVSAYSDAEILALIADAEAVIEAFYADYSSPEEVQAAIDAAIEQYIADHPVKTDDTTMWMCIAAVFGIAAVALGVFLVVALVKAKKEGRRFI